METLVNVSNATCCANVIVGCVASVQTSCVTNDIIENSNCKYISVIFHS